MEAKTFLPTDPEAAKAVLDDQEEDALRRWLDLLNQVADDEEVAALCFDGEPEWFDIVNAQESARDSIHRIMVHLGDLVLH